MHLNLNDGIPFLSIFPSPFFFLTPDMFVLVHQGNEMCQEAENKGGMTLSKETTKMIEVSCRGWW
jgi:hypothetical protein